MLLILWHSRTGGARAMAQAAFEGACEDDGAARLLTAAEAQPADILSARGYLFVCPENLGALTGEMKEFFDRTYYPLLGRIEGRAYATAIAAGSAGQGAQAQIDRIVTGWRLRRVAPPLIANFAAQTAEEIAAPKTATPQVLAQCRELGHALSTGLTLGIF